MRAGRVIRTVAMRMCQRRRTGTQRYVNNAILTLQIRYCYNCAAVGHHWGDDCSLRRTNPTRPTGEPSAFSEQVANAGPFTPHGIGLSVRGASHVGARAHMPLRRSQSTQSLHEDMRDADDLDWFARRQKLRRPSDAALSDLDLPPLPSFSNPGGRRQASDVYSRGLDHRWRSAVARGPVRGAQSPDMPHKRTRRGGDIRRKRGFSPQYRGGYT